jgi:phosphatidylglycerophosphate synthase
MSLSPFTPTEIENAKRYKYNGTDVSLAARLFLRSYWNWAIQFIPLTIAPNLITFIGFLFELSSFFLSFILSKALTVPLPSWLCVWNGISLFIYQTLDNLDGRQARRTNSSSPLGQFFDHGCDALTGVLELIKVCAVMNFEGGWVPFIFVFFMGIGFFLTSYEEYVTHAFYLGILNGPDEGLLLLAIIQVILGLRPSLRWFFANLGFYSIFLVAMTVTVSIIVYNVVKQSVGDQGKRERAVLGILPAVITIVLVVANVAHNQKLIYSVWFIMSAGFVLQFQSQQAIAGHLVLRPPLRLLTDPSIIILWALTFLPLVYDSQKDSLWFWKFYCAFVVAIILIFDVRVVLGLSRGLDIPVFTLKAPQEEEVVKLELDDEVEDPNAEPDVTFPA